MKLLLISLYSLFITSQWGGDLNEAKKIAALKKQLIVLNFSGSDWCIPCIKLRTTILDSKEFKTYADSNLVLVNADFPRLKKNKPSKEQQLKNDAMAELYNPKGKFPYTVILNADGKVLKSYDGLPSLTDSQFVNEIKQLK